MAKIFANKGEWSELYVLLELLHSGKLYSADADLRKKNSICSKILRVLREENNKHKDYYASDGVSSDIEVYVNGNKVVSISRKDVENYAKTILEGIKIASSKAKKDNERKQQMITVKPNGKKGSFHINDSDVIMQQMHCDKVAESNTEKADIRLEMFDSQTSCASICGFSIKSYAGGAPTLLNASENTNFIYEICGPLNNAEMNKINLMKVKGNHADILGRIHSLVEFGCVLNFIKISSETFSTNLKLIDSDMIKILSEIVRISYITGETNLNKLIDKIWKENNVLGYPSKNFYVYKMKKMLCAVALGMVPRKLWDGTEEANAGYIVVKNDGEVLAYYLYDRNTFLDYLMKNTVLERGSTSKHNFAKVYYQSNRFFINLNLQIRFSDK